MKLGADVPDGVAGGLEVCGNPAMTGINELSLEFRRLPKSQQQLSVS